MIKYVLLDLDDTLLDFKRGEMENIAKLLQEYHIPDLQEGIKTYLRINAWTWRQIESGVHSSQLLADRFSSTFAKFGMTVDGETLNRQYLEMGANNFYLIDGARQLLTDLKQAGYHLIAATNGVKRNQIKRLTGAKIIGQFDHLWISQDVGAAKPKPAFFDRLFEAYPEINRDNTIMVGDGLRSDIKGANAAQLKSIWYLNHASAFPTHEQPDYVVTALKQIVPLLAQINQ